MELERFLSPIFIKGDGYGSRSSTIILVDHQSRCTFIEKTYVPYEFQVKYDFQLD